MNNFILYFKLLFQIQISIHVVANVATTTSISQIWFPLVHSDSARPASGFRQEIHAEESEESVRLIPRDQFGVGEEVELKSIKEEKRSGSIEWKVTSKPGTLTTKTKLTLRHYPHRGKFNTGANMAGAESAVIPATAVVPSQTPILLDPPLDAPLKTKASEPKVSRTIRYRTWSSNYSIADFDPKNQSHFALGSDNIHSPSIQKSVHSLNSEIPIQESANKKRPVWYYIPKKAFSHSHPIRYNHKKKYIEPIDYDEYSSETDETSSEEDSPMNYRQFIRNQFTPPIVPMAPTPVIKPQTTIQSTTPVLSFPVLSTPKPMTKMQLTTTSLSLTTEPSASPAPTASPNVSVTVAEASYRKQTYLDHPIAYLMSHLPSSTTRALPTHSTHLSLAADIVTIGTSKIPKVPVTSPLPPIATINTESSVVRPTENTFESAESGSSEEYDDDYDGRANEGGRSSKNRPAVETDEDYSEEYYEETEPPPARKPKKQRSKKVYYTKRPLKMKTVDYPDYEVIETADKNRPVAIYLERLPTRTRKKYLNPKPMYYIKGGRYRHHPKTYYRRPMQLVETEDGQQYFINNNNWIGSPKNPNLVFAYDQPISNPNKTRNVLMNSESQYPNNPGKVKWLNQLNQEKGMSKPAVFYQQVVPAGSLRPFTNPIQPYRVMTDPRLIQYPVLVGNSSGKPLVLPSIPRRTKAKYIKITAPLQTRLNHVEDDGFYALMDSSGRLTPAQLVLTKPKSERVYDVVDTRHKPNANYHTYDCDWSDCQLPDCFCGTNSFIPGNLKVSEVPQMILLTFDDSVNEANYPFYHNFAKSRKNPNGCPITATFFVSHEWTDYSKIQNLYAQGHEMASHSVSHGDGVKFSRKKWDEEILGQKELMKTFGGVDGNKIQGMRAPFLQPGGDNQFTMLQLANFTYDSSLPVRRSDPPVWPYTLDYGIPHECNIAPCPKGRYPGLWEVPLVMWTDLTGGRCSMADACTTPTNSDDIYRMLMSNFEHHYHSNKSPFPMYYHYAWFTKSENLQAFSIFIDTVLQLGDVYLVTVSQMIEWMKNPTPLSDIHQFTPWKCINHTQPTCLAPKTCSFSLANGKEQIAYTCQACAANSRVGPYKKI